LPMLHSTTRRKAPRSYLSSTNCPDILGKSLKELETWLKEEGTDPAQHEHLMEYLCTWTLPTTNPSEPPHS